MHGPSWLQDPTLSFILIGLAAVFLFLSLWRTRARPPESYNIQPKIRGHKILDTGDRWLFFTLFLGLSAFAAHFLAEYSFDIYDVTPIDKFTHGLAGMAITAFVLNFNLTRGRKVYYPTSIGVSWLAFVAWEIFEWIEALTNPNSGIETNLWDMVIDLWVDTLGSLSVCFIYDEIMQNKSKKLETERGQTRGSADTAA